MRITAAMIVMWLWFATLGVSFIVAGLLLWRCGIQELLRALVTVLGAALMFGFVSAVIGLYEMPPYYLKPAFYVLLAIGAAGAGLFGLGCARVRTVAKEQRNRKEC